jgi:putative transposase
MSEDSKGLVIEHISASMLNDYIRILEKVAKKVNRLHFIQQLYNGYTVREACSILKIPERTGYNWLKKWNEEGLDGLNHKKGGGRPSFLTKSQFQEVDDYIKNNDSLGTNEVHDFIENKFGVDYTPKQTRIIINKLKYSWIKPYPIYSKSPGNAKEILKESTKEINLDEDIYGFFDESAFQNHPNISKILKKKEKNTKLR